MEPRRKFELSLGGKLLAVLIPSIALALSVMAFMIYNSTASSILETQEENVKVLVDSKVDELDIWLQNREKEAIQFAFNPVFQQACVSREIEQATALLEKYFQASGMMENLFLADPDGRIFSSAKNNAAAGVEISKIPVYAPNVEAARRGEVWIGTPAKSPVTGRPVSLVTAPITVDGQIVGIFGAPVDLMNISDDITGNVKIGKTGYLFIIDGDGKTVSHPVKENILTVDFKEFEFGRQIIQQKSGKIEYIWTGLDKVAFFKNCQGKDWIVSATFEESEFLARANAILRTVIIISLLVLGALTLLVMLLSRGLITNPLKNINEASLRLARGDVEMKDFDHEARRKILTRGDELGKIGRAFDELVENQLGRAQAAGKIAEGDLTVEVRSLGEHDILGSAMVRMIDSIKSMDKETQMLVNAALEGNLDLRADTSSQNGAYREIVEGLNRLLEAVVEPINEAAQVLEKAASKDLSARVKGDYKGKFAEVRDNVNATVSALDVAMSTVAEAVEQVSSASGQIASGSQSLAQGANEQASSLEEISSSLEEMSSMTRQNADNSGEAHGLTESARKAAERGNGSMLRMSEAIGKIKQSADETANIVKTIDEIAFQTNLLALNAAVEAARAGEAGKGFAVVAEEVRNLAQRSAEAAKNTAAMIEESVRNSESGVEISTEVAAVLDEIHQGSGKVNDLVAEIAAAVKEQSAGIGQVNEAVSQMDQVTQQNASNSEESASAAEELSSQAEQLRNMVSEFTLTQGAVKQRASAAGSGRNAVGGTSCRKMATPGPVNRISSSAAKRGGSANGTGKPGGPKPDQIIPLDDEAFDDF